MALINCPECGGKVSDKAAVCIHCGFPLNKYYNNVAVSVSPVTFTLKNGNSIISIVTITKTDSGYIFNSTSGQMACSKCGKFFSIYEKACPFCAQTMNTTIDAFYNYFTKQNATINQTSLQNPSPVKEKQLSKKEREKLEKEELREKINKINLKLKYDKRKPAWASDSLKELKTKYEWVQKEELVMKISEINEKMDKHFSADLRVTAIGGSLTELQNKYEQVQKNYRTYLETKKEREKSYLRNEIIRINRTVDYDRRIEINDDDDLETLRNKYRQAEYNYRMYNKTQNKLYKYSDYGNKFKP